MKLRGNNLVIGLYYHPEAFPPTLNAIGELSGHFDRISVVHRPHLRGTWKYAANVTPVASGKYITTTHQEQASTVRKILFFLRFVLDLLRECRRLRPRVVLLYDTYALLAYRLIRPLLRFPHVLWYHNHDVSEITTVRKYSVGWFACKAEKRLFRRIDIFTVPSAERLPFFPMGDFRGKYFVVPNYPSLAFYRPFYTPGKSLDVIRLVFQGRIGSGHGLEEIIPLLAAPVAGKPLQLVLKGHCHPDYKQALQTLAERHSVSGSLIFAGYTPYEEVPRVAAACHIGIGIFSSLETMHVTLGTASNKLYEYAAVGLPVLYLGMDHFSRHLGKYRWAVQVEVTSVSIASKIEIIIRDYAFYSTAAHESFVQELNFERCFAPVIAALTGGADRNNAHE